MPSPIIERLNRSIHTTPDKIALIFSDIKLSYKELGEKVDKISIALNNRGIRAGDHIGVALPNGIEFVLTMLAAAKIGAAIVPYNHTAPIKTLLKAFKRTNVKNYILWHSIVTELLVLGKKTETVEDLPTIEKVISVGNILEGIANFNTLYSEAGDQIPTEHVLAEGQAFILTMTSGSTGTPKPIVLSQDCKIARAEAAENLYKITRNDITLTATPLYHSLAERLVLLPLITGGTSVIMASFSPDAWLKTVEEHRVTFSIAVSSQLKKISHNLDTNLYNIDSLRCLVSSSEPLSSEQKKELLDKLCCEFHECYGTSEVAIISNLKHNQTKIKMASVGKAIPNVELLILSDDDEILPQNSIGEIACKTPMLFSGYYQQIEQTKAAMHGPFFRTGDLGKLDNQDFLYYCGRKKEIIITGGINVYPKDVEEVLMQHEHVEEVAVIPSPDASLGEVVAAAIISKAPINQRSLQRHCAKELADYQQPRMYFFLKDLPKNSLGKIMKQTLVDQLINHAETTK